MTTPATPSSDRVIYAVPAGERHEIADWLDKNASPICAMVNRSLVLGSQRVAFRLPDEEDLAALFRLRWTSDVETTCPTFGGTKPRMSIYSRNDILYMAARSWCRATKSADIAALKAAKLACSSSVIDLAADEMASVLSKFAGKGAPASCVTTVAVGHSQRPDSFAVQLAQRVAGRLSLPFAKVFQDRFVSGSSHPKEFAKLPPLVLSQQPSQPHVLLIDDVATSGWHIEEALTRLRIDGFAAQAFTWIGGNVE